MEFLNPNLPEDVKEFLLRCRRQRCVRVFEYHPDRRFEDDPEFTHYDGAVREDADISQARVVSHSGTARVIAMAPYTHYTSW